MDEKQPKKHRCDRCRTVLPPERDLCRKCVRDGKRSNWQIAFFKNTELKATPFVEITPELQKLINKK